MPTSVKAGRRSEPHLCAEIWRSARPGAILSASVLLRLPQTHSRPTAVLVDETEPRSSETGAAVASALAKGAGRARQSGEVIDRNDPGRTARGGQEQLRLCAASSGLDIVHKTLGSMRSPPCTDGRDGQPDQDARPHLGRKASHNRAPRPCRGPPAMGMPAGRSRPMSLFSLLRRQPPYVADCWARSQASARLTRAVQAAKGRRYGRKQTG